MESFRPYSLQYLIDGISGPAELIAPELLNGYFPKDNTGLALWNPGKSAAVFPFLINKQRKAIKIWYNQENKGKKEKYEAIKGLYNNPELPYFSNCEYLSNAVSINNITQDVLLMDWVGRQNIKEYIIANIHEPQKLQRLAEKILELHKDLNRNGIAHGHLNSSNIYIDTKNELQLIDYDTLFIEGITPSEKTATSYPDYVHPSQKRVTIINKQADYFSALILYLGVKTLAENPSLWGRFLMGSREGFIFSQADFADISGSSAYADIKKMEDPLLNKLLSIVEFYCGTIKVDQLQPFYAYLSDDVALQPLPPASITPVAEPQKKELSEKSENGISKKVSIIFPSGTHQRKNQPDLQENKNEIPVSQPIPYRGKETGSDLPAKKEPKKVYANEERVLSDIWIHKNKPADEAIVKVFSTQTSSLESNLKTIERFSKETLSAVEEKLVTEIPKGRRSRFSKKAIFAVILAAIVVSTASAAIYLVRAKGLSFGFVTKTEEDTPNKQVVVPAEKLTVLEIEPAMEDSAVSFAAIAAAADSMEINATNQVANAIPDSLQVQAISTEVATAETNSTPRPKVMRPASAEEAMVPVASTGKEQLEKVISTKEMVKKEKKEIKVEKLTDDILSDNSPSKGFNTGIKTKQKK
jgi:serine/threonine protein kinase